MNIELLLVSVKLFSFSFFFFSFSFSFSYLSCLVDLRSAQETILQELLELTEQFLKFAECRLRLCFIKAEHMMFPFCRWKGQKFEKFVPGYFAGRC